MVAAVECVRLTKVYGTSGPALDDLTLSVECGASFSSDAVLLGRWPGLLARMLIVAHAPLLPLFASASESARGSLGWLDAWALFLDGCYVVALTLIAGFALERRELALQ